jgi:hypothetical protein
MSITPSVNKNTWVVKPYNCPMCGTLITTEYTGEYQTREEAEAALVAGENNPCNDCMNKLRGDETEPSPTFYF